MKRPILTIAAVVAALFFAASAANAGTYYFYWDGVGSGALDDPNNWYTDSCEEHSVQDGHVPDPNDRAVICSGQTCNITSNTTWDTVDVQDGATLNIQGCTLTLENDDNNRGGGAGNDNSNVDGTINLQGSGSTLAFTVNDHLFSGTGSIDGQDNSAAITIATGITLTNETKIEGNCQIMPALGASGTTFINNKIVCANNVGTLAVIPDSIGESSGTWWACTSASAILKIDTSSAATHGGNVSVSNGTLDIDCNFATNGNLIFLDGVVDVANGVTFGCCGNNPRAGTYYFYMDAGGTPGNCNDPVNWYTDSFEGHNAQDGQIPSEDDRAVIGSGQTCNVITNTTWDTVDVDGTLNIQPGYTLTLENDNDNLDGGAGNDHSLVDGTVSLLASGGQYGTLAFTTNDHNFAYSGTPGSIVGADHGCQITLGSDYLDLTSTITISGALAIVESGSLTNTRFINNYKVEAGLAGGTLELAVDYLDDGTNCTTGDWAVSAAGAVLKFTTGSAKLNGDFVVSSGMLDINANVCTEGDLTFSGGTIDVASGVSFKASQACECPE